MSDNAENPIDGLERLFHEPKRLAIVSALAGSAKGLTFTELKEHCNLTDGNLSRHLKMLEDERVILSRRTTTEGRARTVVRLSANGRRKFIRYLSHLEEVLLQAARHVGGETAEKERRLFEVMGSKA